MAQLAGNHALLLYRVGPVRCCAPALCVTTLIPPPPLTHLPNSSSSEPGIFQHDGKLVSLIDLRHLFGVEEQDRKQPGRIIICQLTDQHLGFLVDEVIDVIETPGQGWGQIPPSLSGGVFSRSLLLDKKIHLYCEFEKLQTIRSSGLLKPWIQQLQEKNRPRENTPTYMTTEAEISEKKSVPAQTAIESSTIPPPARSSAVGSTPPLRQHSPRRRNEAVDKTNLNHKQATKNNPRVTENKRRPSAVSANARHSATPSTHTSLIHHPQETSHLRQSPQTVDHSVSMQTNKAETNLQIIALVLICVAIISTIAYLWPSHTSNFVVIKSTIDKPIVKALATTKPGLPLPENAFAPSTETTLDDEADKATTTAADEDQNNRENHYQANIEQRQHEVTIILTAPANDTVLRADKGYSTTDAQTSETLLESTPNLASASSPLLPPQHIDQVIHIVIKGDTLWHIAQRYIHNPFRYPELARLNKIRNPNLIYPGDRVRIIRIYRQQPTPSSTD